MNQFENKFMEELRDGKYKWEFNSECDGYNFNVICFIDGWVYIKYKRINEEWVNASTNNCFLCRIEELKSVCDGENIKRILVQNETDGKLYWDIYEPKEEMRKYINVGKDELKFREYINFCFQYLNGNYIK